MKQLNSYSPSHQAPLPMMRRCMSSASEPLTNSEVVQLRQKMSEKIELLQKVYPNLKVVGA